MGGEDRAVTLTFGSLFAGIGGMDLGLERAGMTCRWQVEIDDYCRRVLTKHWPDVPKYGDIREVTGGELEAVDLICGGFPCQDISIAGNKAGISGARSGLWSDFARLIRVLRPRYVLVENVADLVSDGLDRVLGDLASCGYDAAGDCLPAGAFGAPHLRERMFVVAHTVSAGTGVAAPVNCGFHRVFSDAPQPPMVLRRHRTDSAERIAAGALLSEWAAVQRVPAPEPFLRGVVHGFPNRMDRLRGLGNAVVPQVAEWVGRRILEQHDRVRGR
jgi:DNA (cytosine-5)-methyltransferase 1